MPRRSAYLFFLMLFSACLFLLSADTANAVSQWTISDTPGGGDCVAIGAWDSGGKTCYLTSDLVISQSGADAAIEIAGDSITLDGNGRKLTGSDQSITNQAAVIVSNRSGTTIRGLTIEGFLFGVDVSASTQTTVVDNVLSGNDGGIRVEQSTNSSIERNSISGSVNDGILLSAGSGFTISWNTCMGNDTGVRMSSTAGGYLDHNVVSSNSYGIVVDGSNEISMYSNTASFNDESGVHLVWANQVAVDTTEIVGNISTNEDTRHGIHLDNSNDVQMSNNTIRECFIGIYLRADTRTGSDNLYISDNTIAGNDIGLEVFQASHTLVVRNHFDSNLMQDNIGGCMEHLYFSTDQPANGNHWSEYDEPSEGCVDGDGDGYCDDIFTVFGDYKDRHPMVSGGGACPGCPAPPTEPPADARPALGLDSNIAFWDSYDDFVSRRLSVEFIISNAGPDAYGTRLRGAVASSGVIMVSDPPVLGDIPAGGNAFMTLRFQVGHGITNFTSSLFLTAQDASGNSYDYPGPYVET